MSQILAETSNVYQVSSAQGLLQALSSAAIRPRVQMSCASQPVYHQWRSDPTSLSEYLFVYNDQHVAVNCSANVSVTAQVTPCILDAFTGSQMPEFNYQRVSNGIVSLDFSLRANETRIWLFSHNNTINNKNKNETRHNAGQASAIPYVVRATTTLQTWNLTIQDWHGPKLPTDQYSVRTEIDTTHFSNTTLKPWISLGQQYANVSGVGIYTTTFSKPASSSTNAVLSFPRVYHTLRAKVNGMQVQPLDPVNPVVDINPYLAKAGMNTLEVTITTPLFNRVKAEADTIQFLGLPASSVQPEYKTMPRQEYGLVGPVEIRWI
jgi:hypothetical protein